MTHCKVNVLFLSGIYASKKIKTNSKDNLYCQDKKHHILSDKDSLCRVFMRATKKTHNQKIVKESK